MKVLSIRGGKCLKHECWKCTSLLEVSEDDCEHVYFDKGNATNGDLFCDRYEHRWEFNCPVCGSRQWIASCCGVW